MRKDIYTRPWEFSLTINTAQQTPDVIPVLLPSPFSSTKTKHIHPTNELLLLLGKAQMFRCSPKPLQQPRLSQPTTAATPVWTVSLDKNHGSESTDRLFVGDDTSRPSQSITLSQTDRRTALSRASTFPSSNKPLPWPKQTDCQSFTYLPEEQKILPNFSAFKPALNNKATSTAKSFQRKEIMINWRVMPKRIAQSCRMN